MMDWLLAYVDILGVAVQNWMLAFAAGIAIYIALLALIRHGEPLL